MCGCFLIRAASQFEALLEPAAAATWAARLQRVEREVTTQFDNYRFDLAAKAIHDFIWHYFCDWYLECIKPTVADSPTQQRVLLSVLDAILRIMHPVCPFVTETLWPHVQSHGAAGGTMLQLPPSELLPSASELHSV